MFYAADQHHGLSHDPFNAIIAPRPIGWIGTLNAEGIPNLGPFSYFQALARYPHLVAFSSDGIKHSAQNAKVHGEFTVSFVNERLAEAMNISSAHLDDGANEFLHAGLEIGRSRVIKAPFVQSSPAALECKLVSFESIRDLAGQETGYNLVIGQVMATHINDDFIIDGRFDLNLARPIARCGYRDYATVERLWELQRPDMPLSQAK
ncbi:MAG: flavin reductase family protein [Roseovarius sp.]